jgi:hypothetical protein
MNPLFFAGVQQEKFAILDRMPVLIKLYGLIQKIGRTEDDFILDVVGDYLSARQINGKPVPEPSPSRKRIRFAPSAYGFSLSQLPDETRQALRAQRVQFIATAIVNGLPVSDEIVHQYPEVVLMPAILDASKRTGLPIIQAVIDDRLLSTYGCKIRRQDQKRVSETQRLEIQHGLDELWTVIGDISDICRAAGLTISHTAGRMIRKRPEIMGSFSPHTQTIYTGIEGYTSDSFVTSLAHEMAHFIDYNSVPPETWIEDVLPGGVEAFRKSLNISIIDAWGQGEMSLYHAAVGLMSKQRRVHFYVKNDFLFPSEIWARLVEQWVSWRLHQTGRLPVSAPIYEVITTGLSGDAYWGNEIWEELAPKVELHIKANLWMARKMLDLIEWKQAYPPGMYVDAFPWAASKSFSLMKWGALQIT